MTFSRTILFVVVVVVVAVVVVASENSAQPFVNIEELGKFLPNQLLLVLKEL